MRKLSRRRLLQGLLALGMAPFAACGSGRSPIETLLLGLLKEVALPDPLRVGLAHLRDVPADREPAHLLEAVLGALPFEERLPKLRQAFAQRLGEEFASQNTVTTDGWLLPVSESRFCALLAMCHFAGTPQRVPRVE